MRLSRRWSRMHEIFSWPKANTFSYWKKKFDLNTKTWTKAKPVTESRKTNDDTDHLSTLSGIGLFMIPPCWNHTQKVWIYILYALGYVTANRFDCERSSLSPESCNKLMIFANGRRSSPTGSRKMYSGSHTLELRKTGRKTLIVVCGYLYLKRKNSSFRLFHSICASPIRHFLFDPKILHTLCFTFFRVLHSSQEKLKTMLLQNFGG